MNLTLEQIIADELRVLLGIMWEGDSFDSMAEAIMIRLKQEKVFLHRRQKESAGWSTNAAGQRVQHEHGHEKRAGKV